MNIRTKADLLLALLYAGGSPAHIPIASPVTGITRLEKLLFLLKLDEGFLESVPDKDNFHFVPFRMGPWASEVYDEVDFLESLGLVNKVSTSSISPADSAHNEELFSQMVLDKYQNQRSVDDDEVEVFKLTEAGKVKAAEIWKRLSDDERDRLIRVKKTFNNMNLRQFLRYVYKKHPEYTTESEIKNYLGISE
jgi:hypothetical protein